MNELNENPSSTDVLDPQYPLMIKLKEKAPGTHAHCKKVSSLLITLGNEFKLDTHKLEIAGMYHDIGKTVDPKYFSENQREDDKNPHDTLDPWMSKKIITTHVSDTAIILLPDNNIPRDVIQWCCQHHGTRLLKIFYDRSKSKNEDDYRYKTQRPRSIEAGLLMLCDTVEARFKSEFSSSEYDHETLFDEIFNEIVADEQFDYVTMSFYQQRKLREIMIEEMKSEHHKRVKYEENGNGN